MPDWFQRSKDGLEGAEKKETPEGLWIKCTNCNQVMYIKKLERNFSVCPECNFHNRLSVEGYVNLLVDEGTWKPFNEQMKSADPLDFRDSKRYSERLALTMKKTGFNEALYTGEAELSGHRIVLAIMNFDFLGGSVGSVVGEMMARAIDRAVQTKRSLIVVSCSGGMRMQEGIISLMQMAKTSAFLTRLARAKLPFISIITDPTTGGTTASYSMLGDLNLAEPNALIGFAGPRVIKQTIGQDLPDGFQRSEFLLDHGFLDQVVHRLQLKERLAEFLMYFTGKESKPAPTPSSNA